MCSSTGLVHRYIIHFTRSSHWRSVHRGGSCVQGYFAHAGLTWWPLYTLICICDLFGCQQKSHVCWFQASLDSRSHRHGMICTPHYFLCHICSHPWFHMHVMYQPGHQFRLEIYPPPTPRNRKTCQYLLLGNTLDENIQYIRQRLWTGWINAYKWLRDIWMSIHNVILQWGDLPKGLMTSALSQLSREYGLMAAGE